HLSLPGSGVRPDLVADGRVFRCPGGPRGRGRSPREGGTSALLRIPKGVSDDLMAGKPVALALVRNPAEGILPQIAEERVRTLREVLDGGSRVLRGPLDELRPFLTEGGPIIGDDAVSSISVAIRRSVEGARTFLAPPAITLEGAFARPGSAEGKAGGD